MNDVQDVQYHYVTCDDCGTRLRVRDVVTLPEHRCAEMAALRKGDYLLTPNVHTKNAVRVWRCLCGAPLDQGSCSTLLN